MTLQEELELLCTDYEETLARAMLEKVAWEASQMSYESLMTGYKSAGKSHDQAQSLFDGMMQDYSSRYVAALDEINRASDALRTFLHKNPQLMLTAPRIPRRLGRHP